MISLTQAVRDLDGPPLRVDETSGEEPINENKNFEDKTAKAARETFEKTARLRSNPPEACSKAFLR